MNYLQFDFETEDVRQTEQLIALLFEQDFEGLEEEDSYLKAFIAENKFDADRFSQVLRMFSNISYTQTVVEHINWNQKWEEEFKPVVVDDFAGIRAGFHKPLSNVIHEVIITPKMSFGTGHHATTYLMIQQMRSINFSGKKVLDFGTGTGILAILAEKLGAASVLAIDYDEWSITNTRENLNNNRSANIEVEMMDAVPVGQKFNVILANINLNVITDNLHTIEAASDSGGVILLSGFLKENEVEMENALSEAGLDLISTFQRGDWIALLACKNN
ncbi:MAG: 50S ribosomal protein L11 methyltransferase [Ferruginibacter sp.]